MARVTCDILYIEGNQDDVYLFERALQKSGIPCTVCVVARMPQATSYLKGEPPYDDRAQFPIPDIIISDLAFHADAGVQFVHWLRGQSGLAHIKLLCLSSLEDPLRLQQISDLAIVVIKKSLFFEDIMSAIRST